MSKSKVAFVLLGVFLGSLGIHNFYIGRTKQGVIQLLITVLSAGMLSLASWIWAIVDICTINADASGVPLS
jgi:TM2 domain-containing membrane protein YozV